MPGQQDGREMPTQRIGSERTSPADSQDTEDLGRLRARAPRKQQPQRRDPKTQPKAIEARRVDHSDDDTSAEDQPTSLVRTKQTSDGGKWYVKDTEYQGRKGGDTKGGENNGGIKEWLSHPVKYTREHPVKAGGKDALVVVGIIGAIVAAESFLGGGGEASSDPYAPPPWAAKQVPSAAAWENVIKASAKDKNVPVEGTHFGKSFTVNLFDGGVTADGKTIIDTPRADKLPYTLMEGLGTEGNPGNPAKKSTKIQGATSGLLPMPRADAMPAANDIDSIKDSYNALNPKSNMRVGMHVLNTYAKTEYLTHHTEYAKEAPSQAERDLIHATQALYLQNLGFTKKGSLQELENLQDDQFKTTSTVISNSEKALKRRIETAGEAVAAAYEHARATPTGDDDFTIPDNIKHELGIKDPDK
jgi:hypothetical protein